MTTSNLFTYSYREKYLNKITEITKKIDLLSHGNSSLKFKQENYVN